MMRVARVLSFAATLGAAAGAAGGTGGPANNVQTVRIDVLVSDAGGGAVKNLTPADFELLDEGVARPTTVSPAADAPRLVAIFLDEYHVSAEAGAAVREAVTKFVDRALGPQDRLVVMKPLDSILTIELTTDRNAARRVIQSFEGRKGEYAPRSAYERNFIAGTPARIEVARTQVALSALNALAAHLSGVADQRKTLVVVTDGLGRAERRRGLDLPTIETIIRSADRANVAIYPISPAAPLPDDRAADAVRSLAGETTGRAASVDIEAGLQRALADASAYYLLTYQAERPQDGKFHAVEVRVKRPGAEVRARKGYFAPSLDDALRADLLDRINNPPPAVPLEPAPHASVLIRPWFGMARGDAGKTRITFVWEPAARPVGGRAQRVPTRLVMTALAPDDSVLYEGVVLPTGPGTTDGAGVAPARVVFDMPPGRLRLRMTIQDSAQQVLDSDVRSIAVRDMKQGVEIATPEVLRARNAREFKSLGAAAAVPVASREFSRTEQLLVRFRAYGPGEAPVAVTARLKSRMGGVMRELEVRQSAGGASELDLSLAGLAAGDYIIELTATGTAGNAKDGVDFRVTS
jgi:VWFA-related protein